MKPMGKLPKHLEPAQPFDAETLVAEPIPPEVADTFTETDQAIVERFAGKMKPEPVPVPEDPINPSHYRKHPSGIECIDVTRHLNFNIGNAIKYLWRHMEKTNPIEDLQKAQWYIDDEIRRLKGLR